MKINKKATIFLAGAGVLAAGWYLVGNGADEEITYRLGKVTKGDIVVGISATGTLNPVTTVQVGSQVSGTIARLYVDFNDNVKEGQLLAQLDPTFLQATVNEQRANVSRADAEVQEAERNLSRTSNLFSKALVSQADMDAATTSADAARASLLQARAVLERAEVNLRYATIRSPISGVVISRNVDVGQTVAASLQAPTLFTIARDLRKMQVDVTVDEADIGAVKNGQSVVFRVDAYPEEVFAGNVSQVRIGPTLNQNVVTYTVIVAFENAGLKLLPGMTATVTIEVDRKNQVTRVPIQAVRFTPAVENNEEQTGPAKGDRKEADSDGRSRQSRVWILRNREPVPVPVTIGLQDLQFAELVESDVSEGDEVIVGSEGGPARASQSAQNPFQPQMPTRRRGGM